MNSNNFSVSLPSSKYKESLLKQSLSLEVNLPKLFKSIDDTYELNGAGVSYIDSDFSIAKLREATLLPVQFSSISIRKISKAG